MVLCASGGSIQAPLLELLEGTRQYATILRRNFQLQMIEQDMDTCIFPL